MTLVVVHRDDAVELALVGAVEHGVRRDGPADQDARRPRESGLEIVVGSLILALPDLSLRTVAILAGVGFVLRGALGVYAGWQLRKAGGIAQSRLAPAA